jgi:NADPH-dependent 7-cyano-7-deazaguanine reductase QueF
MIEVKVVPIEATARMRVTSPLRHLCPFVNEVDNGEVTIGWDAEGWTFELHSLRAYLNTFAEREISHEELTEELRAELSTHHGIEAVKVETNWTTAGMGVTCSTSRTPAARP